MHPYTSIFHPQHLQLLNNNTITDLISLTYYSPYDLHTNTKIAIMNDYSMINMITYH